MRRIDDEVEREFGRFGPQAGLAKVVEAWPGAVGKTIARNAWPARIGRDGTLYVNAADAIWAFELTSRATEIAGRVGVEKVRFVPGPLPEAAAEPVEVASDRRRFPSSTERREGERLAATIEDENLRKIVARAIAASLSRGSDGRSVW